MYNAIERAHFEINKNTFVKNYCCVRNVAIWINLHNTTLWGAETLCKIEIGNNICKTTMRSFNSSRHTHGAQKRKKKKYKKKNTHTNQTKGKWWKASTPHSTHKNKKLKRHNQKDTHAYTNHCFLKLAPRGTSAAAHCRMQRGRAFAKELEPIARIEPKQNKKPDGRSFSLLATHTHKKLTWCVVALTSTSKLHHLLFLSLSPSVRALKATCDIFNLAFAFDRHHLLLLSLSARTLSLLTTWHQIAFTLRSKIHFWTPLNYVIKT